MSHPIVSVIILTYNREKLVGRAIESILKQTFREFELIVINNGSSDQSGEIAKKYSELDKRVAVYDIQKSSIGVGRNTGLSYALGDFITFVDDDDTAEPDMLMFLVEMILKENADISLCGSYKEENGERKSNCEFPEYLVMEPEQAVVELLKRKKYNAAMPTKLVRKELFDEIKFCSKGKYDDISVVYRYFAKAKKTVAHGLPKYTFWRHDGNNSAFTTNDLLLMPEQLDEYYAAFRERSLYLTRELPRIADYAKYSEWSYLISMCNKINTAQLSNCSKQLEYAVSVLKMHQKEFYTSPYIEEFERKNMEKYIL